MSAAAIRSHPGSPGPRVSPHIAARHVDGLSVVKFIGGTDDATALESSPIIADVYGQWSLPSLPFKAGVRPISLITTKTVSSSRLRRAGQCGKAISHIEQATEQRLPTLGLCVVIVGVGVPPRPTVIHHDGSGSTCSTTVPPSCPAPPSLRMRTS